MYFGAFQKGQSNIHGVLKGLIAINENRLYLGHLFSFLDLKKKIRDPVEVTNMPPEIQSLKIEDLSFTYPKTEKQVLSDVSFCAKKGEMVAIVGENGSGKTTLVKLINRLYEPTKGKITLNDININRFLLHALRKKISVIFQLFSKYNFTVSENIGIADVHEPSAISKIKESSRKALAQSFIMDLPNQFETQLGRSFRSGEELSGGQWQKIALSRAFYKKSDIIILDEPTSFIDPLAEDEIFNNLREKTKECILILITHRIYNLKLADKIIVLDKGRLIEEGTHESLMKQKGMYSKMFKSQE